MLSFKKALTYLSAVLKHLKGSSYMSSRTQENLCIKGDKSLHLIQKLVSNPTILLLDFRQPLCFLSFLVVIAIAIQLIQQRLDSFIQQTELTLLSMRKAELYLWYSAIVTPPAFEIVDL